MVSDYKEEAKKLIVGSYDLHTHTYPSHFERDLNDIDLIQEASDAKMSGVMIKSHYEPTGSRAALVNSVFTDFSARAYGGLALNWPVGGLNPYAVESASKIKETIIIWMPTRDAENCLKSGDMPGDFFTRPGISILDKTGKLRPEIYDIFDIAKKYNVSVATGHVSINEAIVLCKEGRRRNVRMILTHPEWSRTATPLDIQIELANIGVIIEKNWLNVAENDCSIEYMAYTIMHIGSDKIYISTDRGQKGHEHPVKGLEMFIVALLKEGLTKQDIINLIVNVPMQIVDGH